MKNSLLGCLLVVAMTAPAALSAQSARSNVEEANRLYAEGRYAEAHEKYLEALRDDPGSPVIRFNEGNALYQGQEFQRALEAYRDALESGDPALAARAWYNVGNAFYRQQELEASLEAYKQALRADPNDLDAKHNLERVIQQMEEQEQDPQDDPEQQGESEAPSDEEQEQEDQGEPEEQDDSGDQQQPPPEPDPEQPPPDQPQDAPPPPGQMSREEAERLLQAIQEDPDEVERPPRADPLGRRPRKDW